MINRIRKYFTDKRIEKALISNQRNGFIKLSQLPNVCLLVNADEYSLGKNLKAFIEHLRKEIPSVKQIDVLAFTSKTEKKFTPELLSYQKEKPAYLLQNKSFGLSYNLRHKEIKTLVENQKYDALIVFNKSNHLGLKRFIVDMNSQFNIGYHSEENVEIFDFMMKSELNISEFGREIIRYLKLIDDKS